MPGKPAARVTDLTTHGSPLMPGPGSPNTLIGSLPAWRAIVDQHACPVASVSGVDGIGFVIVGSPTVFINNQMACRIQDIVVEKPGLAMGPVNPIVMGCVTVLIGEVGMGGTGSSGGQRTSAAPLAMAAAAGGTSAGSGTDNDDVAPEERKLAATPGTSPAHRAARERILKQFYRDKPGLGEDRASQDLKGVDLNQPVEVVRFPPPDRMQQYVRRGGRPGNLFSPVEGESADALGVNGSGREVKTFDTPKGEGLLSKAAPIRDTWTDPTHPVETAGGGSQIIVDNSVRDAFVEIA